MPMTTNLTITGEGVPTQIRMWCTAQRTRNAEGGDIAAVRWPLVGREGARQLALSAFQPGSPRGVLLSGAHGVGKTRLASELLKVLRRRRWQTLRLDASEGLTAIPLGVFTSVLGSQVTAERASLARVVEALRVRAEDRPLVLVVDDAHLLDEVSASVVQSSARPSELAVVLTVRTGGNLPRGAERLWTSGYLERIDLEPLTRTDVAKLLEAALDAPVAATTQAALWRLCSGNPLLLREAVLGGLDSGVLTRHERHWQHRGSLASSARLGALVTQSLKGLEEPERAALELLSIGEPLEHAVLEGLVGRGAVAALEGRGLVVANDDGRQVRIQAAHPLHREVLRARLPRSRRRQICDELVTALNDRELHRPEDRRRLQTWQMEAGGPVEARRLIEASRRARLSGAVDRAVRLSQSALEAGGMGAQLACAEALAAAGQRDDADTMFAGAEKQVTSMRQRADVAIARTNVLLFVEGRPAEARQVLRDAGPGCAEAHVRHELTAMEAMAWSHEGDHETALRIANQVFTGPPVSDRALLSSLAVATLAKTMLGEPRGALEDIARGEQLLSAPGEALPWVEVQLRLNRVSAMLALGQVYDAERIGREAFRQAVDASAGPIAGVWGTSLAMALLERGLAAEAAQHLAEATLALERHDPLGILPACLGLRGYAEALLGNQAGAHAALEALGRGFGADGHRYLPWGARAATWLAAADGDLNRAHHQALQGARRTSARQQRVWAPWLLHDLVRLDAPEAAEDELRIAAQRLSSPHVELLTAHAGALRAGVAEDLLAVSDRFAESGCMLLAAEAAAQAGAAHRCSGEERSARRASARMRRLARDCPGVSTPALGDSPRELTDRELEVARLAAGGLTSPEVAQQLTISVRTVENHLHRVYAKLGVDGRRELHRFV